MQSIYSVTPKTVPEVENFTPNSSVGGYVNLTCTSRGSLPPTRLTWFVNRKQVRRSHDDDQLVG